MTWQRIKDLWHAFRNNIVVKVLLCLYKFINFILRIAVLSLILYSAAFSIAASIGLYKGFIYVYDLYDSVESLKDTQPEMSKYMEALKDSNPNIEIKHTFVPLDSININLQKAVIASEDAGFYFHPGFDVYAIAVFVMSVKYWKPGILRFLDQVGPGYREIPLRTGCGKREFRMGEIER